MRDPGICGKRARRNRWSPRLHPAAWNRGKQYERHWGMGQRAPVSRLKPSVVYSLSYCTSVEQRQKSIVSLTVTICLRSIQAFRTTEKSKFRCSGSGATLGMCFTHAVDGWRTTRSHVLAVDAEFGNPCSRRCNRAIPECREPFGISGSWYFFRCAQGMHEDRELYRGDLLDGNCVVCDAQRCV